MPWHRSQVQVPWVSQETQASSRRKPLTALFEEADVITWVSCYERQSTAECGTEHGESISARSHDTCCEAVITS